MFSDRLATKLTLTSGDASPSLPAGAILGFQAEVQAWGFEAEVVFYVSSEQDPDPVFAPFVSREPLTALFTLGRDVEGETEGAALVLQGPVVERSFSEVVGGGVRGAPVVGREYRIRIQDAARAFWGLHRPVELLVDASMRDLLQLHIPAGLTLIYDLPALDTKQRVLCLGFTGEAEPCFYDFLLAWMDRQQGVLELDARTSTLRLGAKKGGKGTPTPLVREDLASLSVHLPEPPRFAGRALNPFSLAPVTQALPNALAVQGVRRDVVVYSPVATTLSERAELEQARFRPRGPFLRLSYARVPDSVSQPGDLLSVDEGFSDHQFGAGSAHRVIALRARGTQNEKAGPVLSDTASVYDLDFEVDAENRTSPVGLLPPFRDPRRVLRVEGKIVSLRGQTKDRSYSPVEDDDDSLWTYKVDLPLFNKVVPVPFAPTLTSGHFFFPAYRGQRVLVDLEWDRAHLVGFLDWADEARLPTDAQGNRLVLGYQAGNGTVVTHAYVDAKPTLKIERTTSEETQLIAINDGEMILSLHEKTVVPAAPPVFDLTAQVEGAKDQVNSEVGGAVGELTATFNASTGKVSAAVDETVASIEAEVGETERVLSSKVEEAQAVLAELSGGASGALAQVSAVVASTRSGLQALASPDPGLRRPLEALLARVELFVKKANGRVRSLSDAIDILGRSLPRAFDGQPEALEAKVRKARTSLGSVVSLAGALSAEVGSLLALGLSPLDAAKVSLQAIRSDVEGDLRAFPLRLEAAWTPALGRVRSLRESLEVEAEVALRRLEARASSLRKKLGGRPEVEGRLAELDGLLQRGKAALAQVGASSASALDQAQSALQSLQAQAEQAESQAVSTWTGLSGASIGAVDQAHTTLRAQGDTVQAGVERLRQSVEQLGAQVDQGLVAAQTTALGALETAERLGNQAVEAARSALRTALSPVQAAGATAERDVLPALRSALGTLEQAEATLQSTVATALATLDAASSATLGSVGGLVRSFESAQSAADTALQSVKELISSLREQIMGPLSALSELLTQVDTLFQTGLGTLTAFIDSGAAALDMIPVKALPKPLVAPTLKAIDGALQAVLPLITTAAQQAGKQLGTLAGTLLQQVQLAERAATQGLSTFTSTVEQQIDAVLPTVRQQLAQVQAQIDAAVGALSTQLETLLTSAIQTKEQALATVKAQLDAACQAAEAQLDALEVQLEQGADTVETTLAEQEAALAQQVRQGLEAVHAALDSALAELDSRAQQAKQTFEATREDLRGEAQRAVDAAGAAQQQARGAIDAGRAALGKELQALVERARTGADQALDTVEATWKELDPAQLVDQVLDPVVAELDKLEALVSRGSTT